MEIDDEKALRLVGFVVGLAAITIRQKTNLECPLHLPREQYDDPQRKDIAESSLAEAHAIANIIVEEAKRLRGKKDEK